MASVVKLFTAPRKAGTFVLPVQRDAPVAVAGWGPAADEQAAPEAIGLTRSIQPRHVLITANAAWNIWNFRRGLVKRLLAEGHRLTVLAPPDDSVPELEALGCRFLALEMDVKGLNPLRDLALVRRFRRVFAAERPDAILSFTVKNNIYGASAARALGIPFIPNVSGLGTAFLSGRAVQLAAEALYRHAFRRLEVVFFQNADDRDLFVTRRLVREDQAHLLPGSGIDLERFAPVPMPPETDGPVFLMIGRLLRDKGVVEFVEAARQVKRSVPGARFQLLGAAGSENRSAIVASEVRRWQEEGVIEHLGTAPDVRPHIAAADCVVLPSYREGAPRTLIEAAAMARPVISTDVPGCRAVVGNGVTGFLCAPRNAAALAAACLKFLELSRAARNVMGQAGRAKMEREYDEARVVDAYRNVLDGLVPLSRRVLAQGSLAS